MTNLPHHLSDERFCGQAIAYGLTVQGEEVVVMQRIFNTIITIGPPRKPFFRDHW